MKLERAFPRIRDYVGRNNPTLERGANATDLNLDAQVCAFDFKIKRTSSISLL